MSQPTLRFITCGSVDDGKSTLIGRLLHESRAIFEDQLEALERDSKLHGTQGERIDFALLVDGLQAEREQGITIDVAYRFFASSTRRFIVADTPGHEQYTRNMATGASTAELAVLLIDARKGVLTQTLRHARIVSMMGLRHVALAVNKMDLVGFDPEVFHAVVADFRDRTREHGFQTIQAIPLSALEGDNVVAPGERMPWYEGPTLMQFLDAFPLPAEASEGPFRMPVQWVNRPDSGFRGYCGRVAQGGLRPGDPVRLLPSGVTTQVREILTGDGPQAEAGAGDAITLTFTDEVDLSRGDLIASPVDPPQVADQFEGHLLWMSEHELLPGRPYLLKLHTKEITATVTLIKHREDVNTGSHLSARSLGLNQIGVVNLSLSQGVAFEPYARNRSLGGFILIDRLTLETVGAGMIHFALRRAMNIHWQSLEVDKPARARLLHQTPRCLWFTGLSGSGKSTVANLLEKRLHAEGRHTYLLDGDNVRHGLNRDLGFTEADRVENVRRMAEVAKLMTEAGLIVLVSAISPFRAERRLARELFAEGEFLEVFMDTPLDTCEGRDPKGLYAKARRGELRNFTGIDSPYEPPEAPEVHLRGGELPPEAHVEAVLRKLRES
ncbi:MAG TPA: sulfate adenylyltransferase subunit CysN [Holophagaceae bacterium]|nr:sulfate adenylyltransferase subunit CysN [Holophagaceae bacterium]